MDLGIAGRRAIICASSKGLGLACATSLAREGAVVWINGRDDGRLQSAAQSIFEATGATVRRVVGDMNTADGRAAVLAACPDPDILINNNHGPRNGHQEELSDEDWLSAVNNNMLSPIAMIRAVAGGMRARGFGRIVNITSAQVKSPTVDMGLSVAARAGLMALAKAAQFDTVAENVTINNLLPGPFRTDRLAGLAQRRAASENIDIEEAYRRIGQRGPAGRIGDPAEFGDACAFLCSAQAGYISGQSLAIDGGAYRGLF
ncbi:SDR family oxidoreductase [Novosphingobium sediminicola]|uniref:3-oxoacyl-[acyl-carrier protein] reductase n=1 Tax=Novosphingobium sediminicola TaxID=563162 RepID=A0A7W6G6X7_9SPHN|nr:SDR family oxidoreductase [Novosphingobium sediminicola]MBB3955798.1 3-oxoacyl-[acyl-carrier protein] reductase [Novosphingobium sediminicola]